jgi:hypothetical protein
MRHFIVRKLPVGLVGLGFFLLAIASGAPAGAAAPTDLNAYTAHGCAVGDNLCLARMQGYYGAYGYYGYGYGYPAVGYAYKDNRFCDDGNVIATPSGYLCANGSPLHRSGASAPVYVGPAVVVYS